MTNTPFLYAIGWSELNAWYLGVRYSKTCVPLDLWTTYFTSSKPVAQLRADFGEPDVFDVLATGTTDSILELESTLLSEFQLHKDSRWLNLSIGGKRFFIQGERDPAIGQKISKSKTGKKASPQARENMSAAKRPSPWNKGQTLTKEHRASLSLAAKTRKKRAPHSAETRAKMSARAKEREAKKREARMQS